MAEPTATSHLHELLLALAGRIDDDLLAWARELVAIGEQGEAVELVVGTLLAERVVVPAPAGELLDTLAEGMGVGPNPSAPLALRAHGAAPTHRFAAPGRGAVEGGPAPDPQFDAVLAEVAERMLSGCQVWRAWRLTPTGGCPGPVPHPVVLVEAATGSEDAPEVLAYQVADALKRAGQVASVEVFTASTAVPEYHQVAMHDAELIGPAEGPFAEPPGEPTAEPAFALDPPTATASDLPPVLPDTGELPYSGRARHSKPPEADEGARDGNALEGGSPVDVGQPNGEYDGLPGARSVAQLGTGPAWQPPLASELDTPASSGSDLLPPGPDPAPDVTPDPWTSPVPVQGRADDRVPDLGTPSDLGEPGDLGASGDLGAAPPEWWRRLTADAAPDPSRDDDPVSALGFRWEPAPGSASDEPALHGVSEDPVPEGLPTPPEPIQTDPAERAAVYERQLAALSGLTDTERGLLRQLHEELVARETQPRVDEPDGVARMFNGRSQPRRPGPPDLAG